MKCNRFYAVILSACLLVACNNGAPDVFEATGIVEGTDIKVSALTGGLLLHVDVDEGQDIEAGAVIAVVDTEKLAYQRDRLLANLGEVEVQRQINLNTVLKAQTDFDYIDTKYKRFQDLFKKKSASQQVLDDLKRNFDAAKTQLENARQNLNIVESRKKALEAQLKIVERQISDATVTAPISGTVTTKYYESGETVPTGFPVVQLIDLAHMWTKVYISELLLPEIKVGQEATVRVDGSDTTLQGFVSWISPKAEFTPKNILTEETRTSLVYAVKVEVANPDKILKQGMPVVVDFDLQTQTDGTE